MTPWLQTAPGRYLLEWEQRHLDAAVGDLFGFHALQLGLPELDALRSNRMPHRWLGIEGGHATAARPIGGTSPHRDVDPPDVEPEDGVTQDGVTPDGVTPDGAAQDGVNPAAQAQAPARGPAISLHCDFDALPFDAASLDLVVLPHALELARDPHQALREVERVLMPEGRVVVVGFNPASLWGLRQRLGRMRRTVAQRGERALFLPDAGEFIGYRRLRDWLRLLSFEVETGRFGCYRPPAGSERWLARFGWMDGVGERWWPVFGAVYFVVAVKRVRGMRLVGLVRKSHAPRQLAAPAVVAHHQQGDDA